MHNITYTTVDRILAELSKDIPQESIFESDVISWIGNALEALQVKATSQEKIVFGKVVNYELEVPTGLQLVLQIARQLDWAEEVVDCSVTTAINLGTATEDTEETEAAEGSVESYCDSCLCSYSDWINSENYKQFTPVRLANHTFFNSIVCREREIPYTPGCSDEYTIVGLENKKFRFSFESGLVAIALLQFPISEETGYPLIPDDISYITAITYYVKMKIAERELWSRREGSSVLFELSRKLWLTYAGQATSKMKMPKSLDEYQNLLESSHHMIPNHRRYYNYFGNLGRPEYREFATPSTNYRR